jgi:hypothetical protein
MRKYIVSLCLGSMAIAGGQKATTLEAVRAYVLSYYQDLPDYTCVQETDRRFTREMDLSNRRAGDGVAVAGPQDFSHSLIEEELNFVGGKETYKVTRVNDSRVANLTHEQLGGTTSTGEYGSLLRHIFDPDTGTSFQSAAPTKLQGRTMNVFTFRVPQAKGYVIYDGEFKRDFLFAYEGSIYADAETNAVMRITMKCVDFPSETKFTAVELTLDYRPTRLSNQTFVLPSHFTLVWRKGKNETAGQRPEEESNTGDFKGYHRFKAASTIDFVNNERSSSGQSENGQVKNEKATASE